MDSSKMRKIICEDYLLEGFSSESEIKGAIFKLSHGASLPECCEANHIAENIYTTLVDYSAWLELKNNDNILQLEISEKI